MPTKLRLSFDTEVLTFEVPGDGERSYVLDGLSATTLKSVLEQRACEIYWWQRKKDAVCLLLWPDSKALEVNSQKRHGLSIVCSERGVAWLGKTVAGYFSKLSKNKFIEIDGSDISVISKDHEALRDFVNFNIKNKRLTRQEVDTIELIHPETLRWSARDTLVPDVPADNPRPSVEETPEAPAPQTKREHEPHPEPTEVQEPRAADATPEPAREGPAPRGLQRHHLIHAATFLGGLALGWILWLGSGREVAPPPAPPPPAPPAPSVLSRALSDWVNKHLLVGLSGYQQEDVERIVDEIERLPLCPPNTLDPSEAVFDYRIHGSPSTDPLKLTYFQLGTTRSITTCAGHRDAANAPRTICMQKIKEEGPWERCPSGATSPEDTLDTWSCSSRSPDVPLSAVACLAFYPEDRGGNRDADLWVFSIDTALRAGKYDVVVAAPREHEKLFDFTSAHLLLQTKIERPSRLPAALIRRDQHSSDAAPMRWLTYSENGARELAFLKALSALCEPSETSPYKRLLSTYDWTEPLGQLCRGEEIAADAFLSPGLLAGPAEPLVTSEFVGDYLVIVDRGERKTEIPAESAPAPKAERGSQEPR